MSVLLRVLVVVGLVLSSSSLLTAQGILLPDGNRAEDFLLPRPGQLIPPTRTSYCIEKLGGCDSFFFCIGQSSRSVVLKLTPQEIRSALDGGI